MGSITDIVVDGLKYPFNDVNKYLGFGVIQVIMSALFMGAFASTGYYFIQAYKTSVSMGLDMNSTFLNFPFQKTMNFQLSMIMLEY